MIKSVKEITINFEKSEIRFESENETKSLSIGEPDAFDLISKAWLRSGWDTKYVYGFTWLGRPIIQLPEDIMRIQEVIYEIKPDLIIETGVAHGGGLVLYASILKSIGVGQVVGVDIEIRDKNRKAIEEHSLSNLITLIEGSSTDPVVVEKVKKIVERATKTLIILDSNHSKDHVLRELQLYGEFVTPGSYIVATDGIMQELVGAPRSQADWVKNNPQIAVEEFLSENDSFALEPPKKLFNEGCDLGEITYWPNAWLKRVR